MIHRICTRGAVQHSPAVTSRSTRALKKHYRWTEVQVAGRSKTPQYPESPPPLTICYAITVFLLLSRSSCTTHARVHARGVTPLRRLHYP